MLILYSLYPGTDVKHEWYKTFMFVYCALAEVTEVHVTFDNNERIYPNNSNSILWMTQIVTYTCYLMACQIERKCLMTRHKRILRILDTMGCILIRTALTMLLLHTKDKSVVGLFDNTSILSKLTKVAKKRFI